MRSSSESNHTECSAVSSGSSIFRSPHPKNQKMSGSTQALRTEILLKKMEWNEVENDVFLAYKNNAATQKKNTVAGNTQRNRCYQNADFYEGKLRNAWRTIVAAVPGAAHAIPVATLLLSPAQHACRHCLMRTVTVSPNFTFFIIGTRIGLVGKRKV